MEMHQVRYFLAVARVLNFTRAAEECNVAQPSLTRAIKQLEDEFGGELFRRERNLTHLSDLGHRMLPLMQQCYDSAQSAKQVASSVKKGAVAQLSIGIAVAINISLLIAFLSELIRVFPGLELRFSRGTNAEISERLRRGDIELAISGPFPDQWDRLEAWPLFSEPYKLATGRESPLAGTNPVSIDRIGKQRYLCRVHCEHAGVLGEFVKARGLDPSSGHKVETETDLAALLAANLGFAIAPLSSATADGIVTLDIEGLGVSRTVSAYAVAGRQRSAAAATLLKMLRAADWSRYEKPKVQEKTARA